MAAVVVVPAAVLTAGTFLASVPLLGPIGTFVITAQPALFVLVGLAGAMVAATGAMLGAPRSGFALAAIGLAAAVGAGTVLTSHVATAERHGADVSIAASLATRSVASGADRNRTVVYSSLGREQLRLDLYHPPPRQRTGRSPIVVYVHGGGWVSNDRGFQAANLRWFADHGFVAVSVDYTLATVDRPTWDIAGSQVACALTWIRDHATGIGGDPDRLYAYGDSAGGQLALATSYATATQSAPSSCGGVVPVVKAVAATVPAIDLRSAYDNDDPQFGDSVKSVVETYLGGPPDRYPDRARAVSPATYISPATPPTLLFLAGNDRVVSPDGAEDLARQVRAAGASIDVIRFRWADHAMALRYHSVINQALLQLMRDFFLRHGA